MNALKKIFSLIKEGKNLLSKKNKSRFLILILLIFIASFAEIISIGSVIPFLMSVSDPEEIFQNERLKILWQIFGIESAEYLPIIFSVLFGTAAMVSGAIRLFTLYISTHVNRSIMVELSTMVFRSLVYKKYEEHSKENSGFVRGIIGSKMNQIAQALNALTSLITGAMISIFVVGFLFLYYPSVTIILFIFFGFFYAIVVSYFNKLLHHHSVVSAENASRVMTLVNDAISGFREIALNGSQKIISSNYEAREYALRTANAKVGVIANFPRFVIESLGLFGLAFFTLFLVKEGGGISQAIPVLALFAMAFQRMLPLVQQAYNGWAIITGTYQSIHDAIEYVASCNIDLNQEAFHLAKLPFENNIRIDNLTFEYDPHNVVIKDLSLTIPKGSRVGIYGKTGTGKTTLTDLLMGFLIPKRGTIFVDDSQLTLENISSWQQNISQVSQKIYVKDSTILENITLGNDSKEIDLDEVKESLRKADLIDFIDALDYRVGEDGINLSGGQIQRLGIARALFSKAEIIFFDEPTSSLDANTAKNIFSTIYSLPRSKTIFIISHQQDALHNCDILLHTKGTYIQHDRS